MSSLVGLPGFKGALLLAIEPARDLIFNLSNIADVELSRYEVNWVETGQLSWQLTKETTLCFGDNTRNRINRSFLAVRLW